MGVGLGVAVAVADIGVSVTCEFTIIGVAVGAATVGVLVLLLAFTALAITRISTITPIIIQARRLSFFRGDRGGIMGGG